MMISKDCTIYSTLHLHQRRALISSTTLIKSKEPLGFSHPELIQDGTKRLFHDIITHYLSKMHCVFELELGVHRISLINQYFLALEE